MTPQKLTIYLKVFENNATAGAFGFPRVSVDVFHSLQHMAKEPRQTTTGAVIWSGKTLVYARYHARVPQEE